MEISKMKVKPVWYLGGLLILGLALFDVSCALIEPPVPPPPVPTIVPPLIPHPLEGRADCRLCHATGVGGAPQFPANHSNRPSDVCLTCHEPHTKNEGNALTPIPTPPVETTPTAVSAGELFGKRCAACHGANRQGIPGLAPALTPESLTALSDIEIRDAILDGRLGMAMPAFKATLSPEEMDALIQFIKYTSP